MQCDETGGSGLALIQIFFCILPFDLMLYRRMMLLYDRPIPGKLGGNVTKREGVGLALIQIFF